MDDNSGYFIIGYDASNVASICKYIFSSSSSQCQSITNIKTGYAQLMISSTQFFVLGTSTSTSDLYMYKLTFSVTTVNWANKILCPSGSWTSTYSESILSAENLTIYSLFIYESSWRLYFAALSASDGSVVATRYKSSVYVGAVYGSALNGDYLAAATSSANALLLYSISTSIFTIKSASTISFIELWVEPLSGR